MNYERYKKALIWLSLMCVFAIPMAPILTPQAFAQGYYRRHDRWERRYDRDHWRRRRTDRNPWVRDRYWNRDPYRNRYGYYDRYGRFHRTGYYNRHRAYPRWQY